MASKNDGIDALVMFARSKISDEVLRDCVLYGIALSLLKECNIDKTVEIAGLITNMRTRKLAFCNISNELVHRDSIDKAIKVLLKLKSLENTA